MAPIALPAWVGYLAAALLGLIAGSFINVVVARLPRLLAARWRAEAEATLALDSDAAAAGTPPPGLAWPGSHCPHCRAPIQPWHNLPLLGFVILRGRCAQCGARISLRYPLIELAAALLAVAAIARFGVSVWAMLVALASWWLLALAAIDWRTQLLPDVLTLGLLWLGLLASVLPTAHRGPSPAAAIVGAAAGYAALWLVCQLFLKLTGKQGMGYGDFKLAAALGAWVGWSLLPLVLLVASFSGALAGIGLVAGGRLTRDAPMPFGPWLAFGGWLGLIAGDTILHAYLTLSGLH